MNKPEFANLHTAPGSDERADRCAQMTIETGSGDSKARSTPSSRSNRRSEVNGGLWCARCGDDWHGRFGAARRNGLVARSVLRPDRPYVSDGDRLVGEVGRGGLVLDVLADGAGVVAAVQAADEPQGHVDSG